MENRDRRIWETINLGYDEEDHVVEVDEKLMARLVLAENAAIIAIEGLTNLKERLYLDEPDAIINLLMVKSAKNIRFAVKGIKMGYYSSASSLLRSAHEDYIYALLFYKKPGELPKWLRNESPSIPAKKANIYRREQKQIAMKLACSEENNSEDVTEAVKQYLVRANKHIHPSLFGLSEEFGIDIDYFISNELHEMLVDSKGNVNATLEKYVLKTSQNEYQFPKRSLQEKEEGPKILIELPIAYDEELLSDLALFAFYISHRLLDYTKEMFEEKMDNSVFFLDYKQWHEDSKKIN